MNKIVFAVVPMLLGVVPTISFAAKCAGTNINNLVSWEPTEISKGSTLATLRVTSVTVNDDSRQPNHLASGECIGAFITSLDGKTNGRVWCARRDKDGDVLYEESVTNGGNGMKGTWKNVGGTGKFAKASGSAEWEVTLLQGKLASVRWSGDCEW